LITQFFSEKNYCSCNNIWQKTWGISILIKGCHWRDRRKPLDFKIGPFGHGWFPRREAWAGPPNWAVSGPSIFSRTMGSIWGGTFFLHHGGGPLGAFWGNLGWRNFFGGTPIFFSREVWPPGVFKKEPELYHEGGTKLLLVRKGGESLKRVFTEGKNH